MIFTGVKGPVQVERISHTRYTAKDKLEDGKKHLYSTIYFCKKCRTAWQLERKNSNRIYCYDKCILGDEYKTCPTCADPDNRNFIRVPPEK